MPKTTLDDMNEHVHEWGIAYDVMEELLWFGCVSDEDCDAELSHEEAERRLNEYDKLKRATEPMWVCEFCFACLLEGDLPTDWDLVLQSAICPSCQKKVAQDGGYHNVPGGSYSDERKDPRALLTGEEDE